MEYIPAKMIVSPVKDHSWFGLDYNMNIYRGCCHGCIYCDSRSECYQIPDFDTVKAKENALLIIRDDLLKKRKRGVVGTGSMSDPYNPFEKELRLTGKALELLHAYRFGVAIATKSALVARDKGVLRDIQEHSPVIVKITVTAASDALSRRIEPGAPPSSERFAAIKELREAGVYAGILLMPILPFIEDNEENILGIVEQAAAAGAKFIYAAPGMTLRKGNREYYYRMLEALYPGLADQYAARYGEAYFCPSPHAHHLRRVFFDACAARNIRTEMKDIIVDYKRGYSARQMSLEF